MILTTVPADNGIAIYVEFIFYRVCILSEKTKVYFANCYKMTVLFIIKQLGRKNILIRRKLLCSSN